MNILAIDTSTKMGSIAITSDDQLLAQVQLNVEVTHTERLLPAIDALMQQIGWDLSQIHGLAVAIGPGSFTGLRVGLATVKGFATARHLPVVGISSLLALAHNGLLSHRPVVAILDAKRKEVYSAAYQFENGMLQNEILSEEVIQPGLLAAKLKKIGPCWLLGDGALVYQELFQKTLGENIYFPPSPMMRLQAKWIAWLAKPKLERGEGKNWETLTPNYLRLSDAEVQHG